MTITSHDLKVLGGVAAATIIIVLVTAPGRGPKSHGSPTSEHAEGASVRHARANRRLAETELRIALAGNDRMPNMYSAQTIQRLRNNVVYAQASLLYEISGGKGGLHKLHLRHVEGQLALAESELAAALAANKQVPDSVNDLEIERLRAAADVARLSLENARDPAATRSPMEHLQWQIDQLRSELTRLHVLMDKVASHN